MSTAHGHHRRQTPRCCEADRPVTLWNPDGFRPEDHLPPTLHRHGDCARYFLHIIHWRDVFRSGKDGFQPLKAAHIRRFFPGNRIYKQIRDSMIERGAIDCDGRYIVGEKCYGYRLGPEFKDRRQHGVAIMDRTLTRKILTNRRDWYVAPTPVHRHLLGHLRRAEIDYPAALAWLFGHDDFEPAHETSLQMLRDGQFFFQVCDYGRVHTNLTNLRSGLRGFLSYRGQPLVNLDIRNSQPLVFGLILKKRYTAGKMPPDVQLYIELCASGKFYDRLMAEAGIEPERRGEFKQKFFGHVFFCKNWPETDVAKLFGRQFPNVYRVIREMKAEDHADLARDLQRAESDLMIGRVATRVMNELPDTFIGTIHDSILTTPDQAETTREIMREEFAKVGLNPTINIDRAETARPVELGHEANAHVEADRPEIAPWEHAADAAITTPMDGSRSESVPCEQQRVVSWLRGVLAPAPILSSDLLRLAKAKGFSERTLKRARCAAGVEAIQIGRAWYSKLA